MFTKKSIIKVSIGVTFILMTIIYMLSIWECGKEVMIIHIKQN